MATLSELLRHRRDHDRDHRRDEDRHDGDRASITQQRATIKLEGPWVTVNNGALEVM